MQFYIVGTAPNGRRRVLDSELDKKRAKKLAKVYRRAYKTWDIQATIPTGSCRVCRFAFKIPSFLGFCTQNQCARA